MFFFRGRNKIPPPLAYFRIKHLFYSKPNETLLKALLSWGALPVPLAPGVLSLEEADGQDKRFYVRVLHGVQHVLRHALRHVLRHFLPHVVRQFQEKKWRPHR